MVSPDGIWERSEGLGPFDALNRSISAIIIAIVSLIIGLWDALVGTIRDPLGALGSGSGNLISAFLNGAAGILFTGARTTQVALLPGQSWAVNLFAFIYATAIVVVAFLILMWYLQRPGSSDSLFGTFTDVNAPAWIPFVDRFGVNEDTGEDEGRG